MLHSLVPFMAGLLQRSPDRAACLHGPPPPPHPPTPTPALHIASAVGGSVASCSVMWRCNPHCICGKHARLSFEVGAQLVARLAVTTLRAQLHAWELLHPWGLCCQLRCT